MKRSILLCLVLSLITSSLIAQKNSKKATTAYAITGVQKGENHWSEVRLVNVATGDVLQTIYESKQVAAILNARTGKLVTKKEVTYSPSLARVNMPENKKIEIEKQVLVAGTKSKKKVIDLDDELDTKVVIRQIQAPRIEPNVNIHIVHSVNVNVNYKVKSDAPFATLSAACAYDKKHDRLYYTPMGINQLRYIDLKSKTPTIYYFEDEPFGALSGPRDVPNQITRMVIAADGNGYALTNNAEHLIRFATNKKALITDLGALSDDASNGNNSVKSQQGYGGDMVASSSGDLYLLTANRRVFKIDIDSRVATFKGIIKGLPKEFSTNGAVVDEETRIIVSSANNTIGYYSFDLNDLQAKKVSADVAVYNASDLANSNLLSEKKKKKKTEPKEEEEVPQDVTTTSTSTDIQRVAPPVENGVQKFSIYPNPVTNGFVKLSFEDHPAGRYQVQLLDISGKLLNSQSFTINNKVQVEEYRLPALIAKGNYIIQVVNETNKIVTSNKLAVQ